MNKKIKAAKFIFLSITVCALICLIFSFIRYNKYDGKSTASREFILRNTYSGSEIYSEFILDNNGEHIVYTFFYDDHFALAHFKRDQSERYQMINSKISNDDSEYIILDVCMNNKEYYVGAIDQDNLKTALITFTYENGEQDFEEIEVSAKGVFLCERPMEEHSITVDYHR